MVKPPKQPATPKPSSRSSSKGVAKATTGLWLVKSEPDDYSIDQLEREGTTVWDGVRNAVAQKNMKAMRKGDQVLFYHSSCKSVGVVGIAAVAREQYLDPSNEEGGRKWVLVDLSFVSKFERLVSLPWLKAQTELQGMVLLRQPRLSVQPVERAAWDHIVAAGSGGSND